MNPCKLMMLVVFREVLVSRYFEKGLLIRCCTFDTNSFSIGECSWFCFLPTDSFVAQLTNTKIGNHNNNTRVIKYAHTYMHSLAYIHSHMYAHIHAHTHACTPHTESHTCMHTRTHACTHAHMHAHICMHTPTHSNMHTNIFLSIFNNIVYYVILLNKKYFQYPLVSTF